MSCSTTLSDHPDVQAVERMMIAYATAPRFARAAKKKSLDTKEKFKAKNSQYVSPAKTNVNNYICQIVNESGDLVDDRKQVATLDSIQSGTFNALVRSGVEAEHVTQITMNPVDHYFQATSGSKCLKFYGNMLDWATKKNCQESLAINMDFDGTYGQLQHIVKRIVKRSNLKKTDLFLTLSTRGDSMAKEFGPKRTDKKEFDARGYIRSICNDIEDATDKYPKLKCFLRYKNMLFIHLNAVNEDTQIPPPKKN